ncbi:hypothetical protein ABPG77_002386 [Micractinium sp. CCAP 211/92]
MYSDSIILVAISVFMLDALVVGGGPAGLAAAHALLQARPGAQVAVAERSDIRPRGATIAVAPNGLRALEAIRPQLKAALMKHHRDHGSTQRYNPEGEPAPSRRDRTREQMREHGEVIVIPWHRLQSTLAEALPAGVLHTNHRFLGCAQEGGCVRAEFDTAQGVRTVKAALLVGADGGQSAVREALLGDGPPQFLGMAIWRAVRPPPPGWAHDAATWGVIGKALTTSVLQGGELSWQAFSPWPADQLHLIGGGRRAYVHDDAGSAEQAGPDGGQRSREEVGAERIKRCLEAFEGYPQHVLDLVATTDPLAVTEHGQFFREAEDCQTYARGRVALVGDAAHLATPFLGQGCSQAIEDGLELGRAVGTHGFTPEALAAYQEVRLPAAGAVQHWSVQLCRQFRAGNLERTEVDVNVSEGFVQRQFEPLAPAVAAND